MKEKETLNEFKPGDVFIYRNGDRYEIGKVKGIKDDTHCWCWYHEGETAASTSVDVMHTRRDLYLSITDDESRLEMLAVPVL